MAATAASSLARRATLRRLSSLLSSSSSSSSHLPSRIPIPRFQAPSRIRFQRELLALSSMLPVHSAIASARLVSKLPSEASACVEDWLL